MVDPQFNKNTQEQPMISEQEMLNIALNNISQGICIFDKNLKLRYWNNQYSQMLEFPNNFLKEGISIEDIIRFKAKQGEYGEGDPEEFVNRRIEEIKNYSQTHPHIHDRIRNGGKYLEIRNHLMPDGGLVITYTDVTERKLEEERHQKLALNDTLTGLANRNLFQRRLQDAINIVDRSGGVVGLLLLDLDRFKLINDTHGHLFGDELLKIVAERLLKCVRKVDTVARMGGDEFAIILASLKDSQAACKPAERIVELLSEPVVINDKTLRTGTSIGMCFYPQDNGDIKELIRKADVALYDAKAVRRGTIKCYHRKLDGEETNT